MTDSKCGADKQLKAVSDSITGADTATCCDDLCSGHNCSDGFHDKDGKPSIIGSSDSECCDADIVGMCSGNTNSSTDMTDSKCGADKQLKADSDSITGDDATTCC